MVTRICCAHAGGQGKTTVTQALFMAGIDAGYELSLASADFIDESGKSKLGRMFDGKVTELGTGPSVSLAKESSDLSANVRYWDPMGDILLKGNVIVDLGANVVDQILNWGTIRRAGQMLSSRAAPQIDVFLVCKAERRAIDDMSDLISRFGNHESLPVRKIFVVLNECAGSFDGLDIRKSVIKTPVKAEVDFIRLPRCNSELWVPMEQRYVSVKNALELGEAKTAEALGVDMWSVFSGIDDLKSWYDELKVEFRRVDAI